MEAKLTTVNRFDVLEYEELKRMIESDPFRKLQERIAAELKRATETCTRSDQELEVMRSQGAVAAFHTALEIPARLLSEMKR